MRKIVKYGLEKRALELQNAGTPLRDIAAILSAESNIKISKDTVSNFFKSDIQIKAEIVQKKEVLKLKVTEAEISTIEDRQTIIKGLLEIAQNAEHDRDRTAAYKVATEALDSLDKRLGKLSGCQGLTINNINAVKLSDIPTEQLLRMVNVSEH